jgi:RNA-binding protein
VTELTGKQRSHLRALGHKLDPMVQLGKNGLTPGALRAIDDALGHHELIKVKLLTECPEDRDDVATRLGSDLKAHVAQTVGRTVLLYRRHPKKPVIQLP